jgi:hypothetical protein
MSWQAHDYNFDIAWQSSSLVSTYVARYGTVLGVNSSIYNVVGGQTVALNGIAVQTVEVRLSICTILMAFKLTGVNTAATLANICVFTNTAVGPNESHYMSPITGAQGLYWSGEYQGLSYTMAIVAGGYPLTTAISAYWFGDWRDMGTTGGTRGQVQRALVLMLLCQSHGKIFWFQRLVLPIFHSCCGHDIIILINLHSDPSKVRNNVWTNRLFF